MHRSTSAACARAYIDYHVLLSHADLTARSRYSIMADFSVWNPTFKLPPSVAAIADESGWNTSDLLADLPNLSGDDATFLPAITRQERGPQSGEIADQLTFLLSMKEPAGLTSLSDSTHLSDSRNACLTRSPASSAHSVIEKPSTSPDQSDLRLASAQSDGAEEDVQKTGLVGESPRYKPAVARFAVPSRLKRNIDLDFERDLAFPTRVEAQSSEALLDPMDMASRALVSSLQRTREPLDEGTHESTMDERTHEPTHEPNHESEHESAHESTQESTDESAHEPAYEPAHEPAHEPANKSVIDLILPEVAPTDPAAGVESPTSKPSLCEETPIGEEDPIGLQVAKEEPRVFDDQRAEASPRPLSPVQAAKEASAFPLSPETSVVTDGQLPGIDGIAESRSSDDERLRQADNEAPAQPPRHSAPITVLESRLASEESLEAAFKAFEDAADRSMSYEAAGAEPSTAVDQ